MAGPATETGSERRKVASQGALLLGGFALAQVLAFARNALLGHLLAPADFGAAMALTVTLQVFETVTDVAADRLIVQAEDGDHPRLLATAHTLLVLRGMTISALLTLAAPMMAELFGLPEAAPCFAAIGLVPLARAFLHLDSRRAQRELDNRQVVALELLPQLAAVLAAFPIVRATGDYTAAAWIIGVQAVSALLVSHLIAATPYRWGFDTERLGRMLRFGWPVMLSAIPLLAVYQGDRLIVGRYLGLEELAGYSAAFLVTMTPVTLMSRAGLSLMLPLLAGVRGDAPRTLARFRLMCEATTLASALYAVAFVLLGGLVVGLGFGAHYADYGDVAAALAVMWSIRLVQMPIGALMMADGDTRPLLTAGVIRAFAIGMSLAVAASGGSVLAIAVAGSLGELASLGYLARRVEGLAPGALGLLLTRAVFLLVTVAGLVAVRLEIGDSPDAWLAVVLTAALGLAAGLAGTVVLPAIRSEAMGLIRARTLRGAEPA